MAIKKIVTVATEDHDLYTPSEALTGDDFGSDWLTTLITDLKDTMLSTKGAGISAPQIGMNKKVILFGGTKLINFPTVKIPLTVLINPSYEAIGETKVLVWEHCLSLPGMRGYTSRPHKIKYTGFDATGEKIEGVAEGVAAILIQHEIDHINGKLYSACVQHSKDFGKIADFEKERGPDHHKCGLTIVTPSLDAGSSSPAPKL